MILEKLNIILGCLQEKRKSTKAKGNGNSDER